MTAPGGPVSPTSSDERSRRGASAVLALAWSVVIVLQARATLVWAVDVPDGGAGAGAVLATVVAGTAVVAVVGVQRARGGAADLGPGSTRFVAGVAWTVLALVLLFVAWSAVWVLGDPSAGLQLLCVAAAVAPSLAAQAVLRRLRTLTPGTGGEARVAGGLVGVSLLPLLLAGVLLLGAAALAD
jgi:hypothetical protein